MLEVIVVLVVFGLVALLLGMSRWLAARPWASAGNAAIGIVLLLTAYLLWPAAEDLRTYERLLPRKALVAQVYCERAGTRGYRVTLTRMPNGRMQVFEMAGDEWQLDARTLVWRGRAAQLGLRSGYRLDRLTARPAPADAAAPVAASSPDAASDPISVPTAYVLDDGDASDGDIWARARTATRWASEVDARLASGPWQRLADGARYDIWLTLAPQDGKTRMDVQPGNEAAAKAMGYTDANKKARSQG